MKYYSGAFILLLLFVGLKKNTAEEVSPAPTSSCGSSTSITPCSTPLYHCMLWIKKSAEVSGGNLVNSYTLADANFSNVLSGYTSPVNTVAVDTVKLNGVPMYFDSSDKSYNDTTFLSGGQIAYPSNWEIDGNNGIPSFTFTDSAGFAGYAGYQLMPDTIYPAQGVSFILSGLTNSNTIIVQLQQGSQLSVKTLPGNSASVSFNSGELTNFTAGAAVLSVTVIKNNVQSVYGKIMNFANSFTVSKSIIAQ